MGVEVDPSKEVVEIMKGLKEVGNPTFQMQEYMKHNADYQRRLISMRESRALLEKTHRMRKERASHMGFQFKQILWQMRRAQDDAYVTQERYLKLLQLEGSGHGLRFTKGNARVEDEGFNPMPVNQVDQQSGSQDNQDASHHNEHQNATGSSQYISNSESAPIEDKNSPCAPRHCPVENLEDLHLIRGTGFRLPAASEENHDSIVKKNCDAHETQSYLASANNSIAEPREESSNVCERDDFVSTSLFVCGNLDAHDSHELFLEQRKKAENLLDHGNKAEEDPPVVMKGEEQDKSQGLSWEQEITDDSNDNLEVDLPVSMMHISSGIAASAPQDPPCKEEDVVQEDVQNKNFEDGKRPFLKIEKNDLLSQKIATELEDFTKNPSLGCHFSKPIATLGAGNASINKVERACEAEGTAEKSSVKARGDTVESKTFQEHADNSSRLTMDEKRKIMEEWYPHDKLGVLTTITNTMFLWKVENSSILEQNYGNWHECEPLVSAAHAARGGQRELFEFMGTVGEHMSRPLVCCGAVCELLKAYPPENLLPFKFIEDFFAYASKEANDQSRSVRPIEGLTFDHLEVYQDEEDTRFWRMLVHHVVSVKDHKLASFRQIAPVFVKILLPSTRMEDYPLQKAKDLHQDLLQFLVNGFRSKASHLFHVHYEDDREDTVVAEKRFQTISKDLEGKSGSLTKRTAESQHHFQKAACFTGLRSRRSGNLRRVSTRKGLLSCFGSNLKIVRTNFKLWRLKALSRGVDTVDEAVVSLLRRCREQETAH